MAKSTAKPTKKTAPATARVAKPKSTAPAASPIEKACTEALKKLQSLGIDQQLQSDIEWCLGSFRHDGNPSGLYEMAARALTVLQEEKAKKTKGITTKVISDLESALKAA